MTNTLRRLDHPVNIEESNSMSPHSYEENLHLLLGYSHDRPGHSIATSHQRYLE